ncbi:helix-turn-helix domain-containing protein [Butyrivibrio sp. INlla21]|uniref:helix-turn-helix domain-containing protein n=1 Tax=Butyrivibrio sp. INlla21 TaxID=1520811 RepID=UPI0008E8BDAE|nr:helix-turn-helix domain-containing protein [Butyrivibrio sp. INlla21]SFU74651.1 Helix-turn-helix domain of resolvase [Butyrivibrio sp. INlla21]
MIKTLDDALKRISELEEENSKLKEELKYYKSKKFAGRQKHDEHWMQSYNNFVIQYEGGMTIMEIVDKGEISRRTAYRYKAYYERLKKMQEK